jgi:hypothetical protein
MVTASQRMAVSIWSNIDIASSITSSVMSVMG